jgi:two-component system LytT family response regulator
MSLRAIIIDDEETGIETLRLLIERYISDVKVVAEATHARDAIELIGNYKPEIVFLDISMPDMSGFELLEKLEWKDFSLVFTTAHREHALKALKLKAMDYLLKPVDHHDLRLAVDRIKEQLVFEQQKATVDHYTTLNSISQYAINRIGITSRYGVEYLDPLDIVSFESQSNYTRVSLSDGRDIVTPRTLGEFEQQLCHNSNFMRVHHSFVINLHKVLRYVKVEDQIIMANSQKVPLAKSRRENFHKWLNP